MNGIARPKTVSQCCRIYIHGGKIRRIKEHTSIYAVTYTYMHHLPYSYVRVWEHFCPKFDGMPTVREFPPSNFISLYASPGYTRALFLLIWRSSHVYISSGKSKNFLLLPRKHNQPVYRRECLGKRVTKRHKLSTSSAGKWEWLGHNDDSTHLLCWWCWQWAQNECAERDICCEPCGLVFTFFRDGKKRSHTGHSICRVRGTADDGADDFCLISSW